MKKIKTITTMLCFSLYGCNSEVNIPINKTSELTSNNIFKVIKPNVLNILNISEYTSGNQVELIDLVSSSLKKCNLPEFNNKKIYLNKESGKHCIYEYKVKDSNNNEAISTLSIFSSDSISPIIEPLSDTITLSIESKKSFDLTKLIIIPANYYLDVKNVFVIGQEGNKGTVRAQNNVIEYTAPTFAGWNRIVFNLINPEKPESPIMGTIYITISDGINTAPTINKPVYDYNHENGDYVVNQELELDLLKLKNLEVSDKENDGWQVVYAYSMNAIVKIVDPNSVQNKKITFNTDLLGEHIITYIVSDHMNAATVGFIKINASVRESEKKWTDLIIKNDITENAYEEDNYSAPKLYSEVIDYNVKDIWDEGVQNTIAGFNKSQAINFCQSIGKIPFVTQLTELYELSISDPAESMIGSLSLWPKLKPYLALDENNNYVGVNLTDGTLDTVSDTFYLTCINNGMLNIETINNSIVANGEFQPVLRVLHKKESTINIQIESDTIEPSNITIKSDPISESQKQISVSSTQIGPFKIKVSSDVPAYQLISETINLIDDVDTAKIASVKLSKNTIEANGEDTVIVEVKVTDGNNNPIAGKSLDFRFSDIDKEHIIFPNEPLVTDEKGILNYPIKIKSSFTENVLNFEVAINPEDIGESVILSVGPSIICEPGFNDSAKGKCLKATSLLSEDNTTYYYSSPPSLLFYQYIKSLYPEYPEPPTDTGVGSATNYILLTQKDDIFGGSQPVLESMYPSSEGKFVSFSKELVDAWCVTLSKIKFNNISNWQSLDFSQPAGDTFIQKMENYHFDQSFDFEYNGTGYFNNIDGWPFYNPQNVIWVKGREHPQSSSTEGFGLAAGDTINKYAFNICSGTM